MLSFKQVQETSFKKHIQCWDLGVYQSSIPPQKNKNSTPPKFNSLWKMVVGRHKFYWVSVTFQGLTLGGYKRSATNHVDSCCSLVFKLGSSFTSGHDSWLWLLWRVGNWSGQGVATTMLGFSKRESRGKSWGWSRYFFDKSNEIFGLGKVGVSCLIMFVLCW